jgi:hypothetical protein
VINTFSRRVTHVYIHKKKLELLKFHEPHINANLNMQRRKTCNFVHGAAPGEWPGARGHVIVTRDEGPRTVTREEQG